MNNARTVDGDRVWNLRMTLGYTQEELSRRSGVSVDTIVRWEGGRGRKPHPASLGKVSKALGVGPTSLLS